MRLLRVLWYSTHGARITRRHEDEKFRTMRWDIIHLVILSYTILLIIRADYLGLGYFSGTRPLLPRTSILRLHYGVLVGLAGMIVSGIFLLIPLREYLITQPMFYLKMFFVLVLVLNAGVIGIVS